MEIYYARTLRASYKTKVQIWPTFTNLTNWFYGTTTTTTAAAPPAATETATETTTAAAAAPPAATETTTAATDTTTTAATETTTTTTAAAPPPTIGWSASTAINAMNYAQCCDVITYLYETTKALQKRRMSVEEATAPLGALGLSGATLATSYEVAPPTQSLMSVVAATTQPGVGVIAFRGTLTPADIAVDAASPVSRSASGLSFPGEISESWYSTYSRGQRALSTNGCLCASRAIKDGECYVLPASNVQVPGYNCTPKKNLLGMPYDKTSTLASTASMRDMIVSAARALNLQSFIITGHSMGGVLATYCAADLQKQGIGIHSVYLFASPKPGDRTFVDSYNAALKSITYSIVCKQDLVPLTPRPDFFAVGTNYSFSRPNAKPLDAHKLSDNYKNYALQNNLIRF